jgi:hypothetical protein
LSLLTCEIFRSHSGVAEDSGLLCLNAVSLGVCISQSSEGPTLLRLFDTADEGTPIRRNAENYTATDTASHLRTTKSSLLIV